MQSHIWRVQPQTASEEFAMLLDHEESGPFPQGLCKFWELQACKAVKAGICCHALSVHPLKNAIAFFAISQISEEG